jgi:hypothetical protein
MLVAWWCGVRHPLEEAPLLLKCISGLSPCRPCPVVTPRVHPPYQWSSVVGGHCWRVVVVVEVVGPPHPMPLGVGPVVAWVRVVAPALTPHAACKGVGVGYPHLALPWGGLVVPQKVQCPCGSNSSSSSSRCSPSTPPFSPHSREGVAFPLPHHSSNKPAPTYAPWRHTLEGNNLSNSNSSSVHLLSSPVPPLIWGTGEGKTPVEACAYWGVWRVCTHAAF